MERWRDGDRDGDTGWRRSSKLRETVMVMVMVSDVAAHGIWTMRIASWMCRDSGTLQHGRVPTRVVNCR